MELKTERLNLRELLWSDLTQIHDLHSLPETDKYNTMGIPGSIESTKKLMLTWLDTKVELPRKKYIFCIENKEGTFIGLTGLTLGKPLYRNAEIWYKLHPESWNKGYATETVTRLLYFGFKDLNLHRIEAGCAVDNIASLRVLEKVGMLKEGHCRKLLPIRGQWVDNFEYAILESDFHTSN